MEGAGESKGRAGEVGSPAPPEQGQAPVQQESPCPGRGRSGRWRGAPGTACSQPMGSAVRRLNPRYETPGLAAPGHVPWSQTPSCGCFQVLGPGTSPRSRSCAWECLLRRWPEPFPTLF